MYMYLSLVCQPSVCLSVPTPLRCQLASDVTMKSEADSCPSDPAHTPGGVLCDPPVLPVHPLPLPGGVERHPWREGHSRAGAMAAQHTGVWDHHVVLNSSQTPVCTPAVLVPTVYYH